MRILSIDWDYFIHASLTTRIRYFPDGGDFGNSLEQAIWFSHYAMPGLDKIGVNKKSFKHFKDLLAKQGNIPIMLVNSHKHCYRFVNSVIKSRKKNIELINVDFHHDVYSTRSGVIDCGNWLTWLMSEKPEMKVKWVRRSTSDTFTAQKKLDTIAEEDVLGAFDAVFICRSGLWSPPHLDKYFKELASVCLNKNTLIEDGILDNRYDENFIESVNKYKDMLNRETSKYKL